MQDSESQIAPDAASFKQSEHIFFQSVLKKTAKGPANAMLPKQDRIMGMVSKAAFSSAASVVFWWNHALSMWNSTRNEPVFQFVI